MGVAPALVTREPIPKPANEDGRPGDGGRTSPGSRCWSAARSPRLVGLDDTSQARASPRMGALSFGLGKSEQAKNDLKESKLEMGRELRSMKQEWDMIREAERHKLADGGLGDATL